MGLSSRYIFNLDKFSLEMLVEISPLGLGREFYSGTFGIGYGRCGVIETRIQTRIQNVFPTKF